MTGPSRAGLLPTSWGQSGGSWWSERKCLQGQVPQVAEGPHRWELRYCIQPLGQLWGRGCGKQQFQTLQMPTGVLRAARGPVFLHCHCPAMIGPKASHLLSRSQFFICIKERDSWHSLL